MIDTTKKTTEEKMPAAKGSETAAKVVTPAVTVPKEEVKMKTEVK